MVIGEAPACSFGLFGLCDLFGLSRRAPATIKPDNELVTEVGQEGRSYPQAYENMMIS